jgi:murein DD-endopeptidase MepM/ murein hydrolase activator NlpD
MKIIVKPMKKGLLYIYIFMIISANVLCQNRNSNAMKNVIIVEFPLHGTWISPNTPGKRIPSHGTDKYGETYAYDFTGVNEKTKSDKFYNASLISYLIKGVPLNRCFGWGSEIYAPCNGEIVKAEDGVVERNPANLKNDLNYMRKITERFKKGEAEYREVAGNYIIMKCSEDVYALFAHLQMNSICVKEGENVETGQLLGRVGHSGNSTAPHLHFQCILTAKGVLGKGTGETILIL